MKRKLQKKVPRFEVAIAFYNSRVEFSIHKQKLLDLRLLVKKQLEIGTQLAKYIQRVVVRIESQIFGYYPDMQKVAEKYSGRLISKQYPDIWDPFQY